MHAVFANCSDQYFVVVVEGTGRVSVTDVVGDDNPSAHLSEEVNCIL
jgi:hypothetical protein